MFLSLMGLAAACGPSGPSEQELVGTWQAEHIEYVSTAGLGSVDIVPLGGGIELELAADGNGVLRFILGPSSDWSWDMSMDAGRLHPSGIGTSWDFDGDGVQDPADWNLVLVKI